MFKKTAVPELQRRLEKSELPEDVVVIGVTVQNVDYAKLHDSFSALASFEQGLKDNIGQNCGKGVSEYDVQCRFQPGTPVIQCVISVPPGVEKGQVVSKLAGRLSSSTPCSLAQAMSARMASGEDIDVAVVDPTKNIQVTDISAPTATQIHWADMKLGKKHKIPSSVFKLLGDLRAMDDCRGFTDQETRALAAQGEEIVWALTKCAEVFKEARLEKTFSVLISNLYRKSRRSCNEWMASLAPGNLQFILSDNPKTKDIFARSRGFPRAEIMQYAAECKACVAMAVWPRTSTSAGRRSVRQKTATSWARP
jgi:hypothetical protein